MPHDSKNAIQSRPWTATKDLWHSFWSLPFVWRRVAGACTVFVVYLTIVAWQVMLPMVAMGVLVATFLRRSRSKDAL